MATPLVYSEDYFNNAGTFGDAWNAVGQIGAALVGMLPALSGGGPAGGPARGLAAINAVGQQAIQSLQQLLAMVNSGQAPAASALPEAQRIAAALNNPQYVFQAQNGSDAAALNNFKAQAAQIVQQIQARVNAGGSSAAPSSSVPPSSTEATSTPGFTISPVLMLIVFGGLGLLALRR